MHRTIARWRIDHDPETTRRCYAQLPVGTGCSCSYCRNFEALADRAFPRAFVELLDLLGVEPTKPAELCHYCREPSGLYLTGGWFHFVGSILNQEDALLFENDTGTFRYERLTGGLEFEFTACLALVPEVFTGLPVVQIEFLTRLPWVLPEPEPEA